MPHQLQAELVPTVERLSVSSAEQSIFDRFRPIAMAVIYKTKRIDKLVKKDWFVDLMSEAGLLPENSSPQAISLALNEAAGTKVKLTDDELNVALPALCSLSKALELSHVEKLILAFLVSLVDERNFWLDFNVQLDEMPKAMTVVLIAEILQVDAYQARLALDPGGRLCKSGVLEHRFSSGRQSLPLSAFFKPSEDIDIHMFRSLTAWNDFFASKFDQTTYSREGIDFSHLGEEISLIETCLADAVTHRNKGMHVLLYGPPGTGKTTLARELANSLKFELFEVRKKHSNFQESDGEARFRVYKLGQQLGLAKGDCLMLFDELEDLLPSRFEMQGGSGRRLHKGWICDSLEKASIPTIWTSNSICGIDPAVLRRFTFTLEVPVPPKRVRRRLLGRLTENFKLSSDWIERTASLDSVTPAMIRHIADLAQSLDEKSDKLEPALDLWLAGHLKAIGAAPLPPMRPAHSFRCELMNIDMPPKDIIEGLKLSGEGRLCLYGPPGTGKTAFARHLAEELGVEAIVKRGSDIRSKWVGETEQNIARFFEESSRNRSVLILDEADSFFAARSASSQSWEANEVSEFLVQLENFQGVFCATTNRFEYLDTAFTRRFDFKIKLDYVSLEQRMMMFEDSIRQVGTGEAISEFICLKLRSLDQLTPGDFMTAVRRLRFSQRECSQANLFSALVHEVECKTRIEGRAIGFI